MSAVQSEDNIQRTAIVPQGVQTEEVNRCLKESGEGLVSVVWQIAGRNLRLTVDEGLKPRRAELGFLTR